MADTQDRELVERSIAGDARSFEELIDRYQNVLMNAAYRMVNDFDDASDVTQSTLIKAYRKLDTYDPKYRFFSWIYRILVNESINLLKARKRQAEISESLPAPGRGPAETYESIRRDLRIQSALMELPIDHRIVIVLRHFLDLSYSEMGGVLDLPSKTIKSRLFTARRRLGRVLLDPAAVKS